MFLPIASQRSGSTEIKEFTEKACGRHAAGLRRETTSLGALLVQAEDKRQRKTRKRTSSASVVWGKTKKLSADFLLQFSFVKAKRET